MSVCFRPCRMIVFLDYVYVFLQQKLKNKGKVLEAPREGSVNYKNKCRINQGKELKWDLVIRLVQI